MDNATLGSPKSQNPKYLFPSQHPQIYGEQALDHRYQYIGSNNFETLLNAIEVLPSQKRSYPNHFAERNNENQSVNNRNLHEKQLNQHSYHAENQKQHGHMQEQTSSFHSNRLLPPPVSSPRKNDSNGALTPGAMSISSLIDLEQPMPVSTPLTPPDTTLNMFPGLST